MIYCCICHCRKFKIINKIVKEYAVKSIIVSAMIFDLHYFNWLYYISIMIIHFSQQRLSFSYYLA